MTTHPARVFISYRRTDAAGYAGRLEEALEAHMGAGSVFRDVQDLQPGEDFVDAIGQRLAGAHAVLVLIGPHWAGGEVPGQRRLDSPADLVRQEVAAALASPALVVPLLLPGSRMPLDSELPPELQPLTRRNALTLSDVHWHADVQRLAQLIGKPPQASPHPRRRSRWPRVAALLGLACTTALLAWWAPWTQITTPDPAAALLGAWQAPVRYPWGDRRDERFEFKRHAGELTGTASFLGVPRGIEQAAVDGIYLRFETRTQQSMGTESRVVTHRYSAELRGRPPDERLALRMHSQGGFDTNPPLEFEARRVLPAGAASGPAGGRASAPGR